MRFEDIFLQILREQDEDDDDNLDFLDDPNDGNIDFPDGEFAGGGQDDPEPEPEPDHPEPQAQPINQRTNQAPKVSRTQQIKLKWKSESPETSDVEFTNAVSFFNERKDRLKPYKPYGTRDETTGNYYINLPEIVALVEKFPNMEPILSDPVKIKDMGNYTWDQMAFYRNRFFQQVLEEENENFIQGDYTEDQRIEMALQRWTKRHNRIFNESNTIIYKIESQGEAIALGALEHAIWRKYNPKNTKRVVTPEIAQIVDHYSWAYAPWCIANPNGGLYGKSLWTNYRPEHAFYFVLDNNRPEYDKRHISTIERLKDVYYDLTTMTNSTSTVRAWSGVVDVFPQLKDKENLFPYFGTTAREKNERNLNAITFKRGDDDDFATQPEAIHTEYINDNRLIQNARCFLTLSLENRKLYIQKTRKAVDDYKRRFLCTNPQGDPFAILNILKNQKLGGEDLYKFLDNFILKTREGVPEGILAIKLSIIGTKWKRIMTDIENDYTLFTMRTDRNRYDRNQKFGIINPNNLDIIYNLEYFQTKLQSYMNIFTDENGQKQRKIYTLQRYARDINQGQNPDQRDYFYFLYLKGAMTDKNSQFYLIGKYFNGPDGDAYIREKVGDRTLIKLD